jgi:glycosyltransferase involved in cell wall biosynthesis
MKSSLHSNNKSHGVTLVISSLECGGAERVLKNMTDFWVEQGRPVTVITLFSQSLDFFKLDKRVDRIDLGLSNKSFSKFASLINAVKVAWKLRQALKDAGNKIVISFIFRTNILTLLMSRFMSVKVIVTEHTDPRQRQLGAGVNYMRKVLYPKAAAVVVLTDNVKTKWADKFIDADKVKVIPNPIAVPVDDGGTVADLPVRYIVTMGRLIPDKGHKYLLDAFVLLKRELSDLSLVILGDGPEKQSLKEKAKSCGIKDSVLFLGHIHNVFPILIGAECFVLSSLREGFPLALAEAMSCGIPSVSFDCPSGPAEIIRDGVDGILVPTGDVEKLASAIIEIVGSVEKRKIMGIAAECGIAERFSVIAVMAKWDTLCEICLEAP